MNSKGTINEKNKIDQCKTYDELPLFMDVKQVANVLGISRSTVYELAKEQGLPFIRIGTKIIIPKENLIEWVSTHTEST